MKESGYIKSLFNQFITKKKISMKVLIGMNPKGHANLAMDELTGLNKIGLECRPVSYGRRDFSVNGTLGRLLETISNSFKIISTLYKFSPDILYLNSRLEPVASVRDFITIFLIKCFYYKKLKIVIKSHGSDLSVFTKRSILYRRIIVPYLTRQVDLWLFLSREEKRLVRSSNPRMAKKILVTCNIIEPSRLISSNDFRKKFELNNDKLKIAFIGRVINEKGVFEFLKAIPLIKRKELCDFILVGDGDALAQAKGLAGELNVSQYIRFLGWVDQDEAESFYDSVDILVFPTFFGEGFPMALFKSVVSGLPVITTRIRAATDHLTMPENVIWVAPRSEEQVADAINQLISNEELRRFMSDNNKKLAARFSQTTVCDEMGEAFMSLYASPKLKVYEYH
jgi:glycosyltransferase involved in cell wall biosynthesis